MEVFAGKGAGAPWFMGRIAAAGLHLFGVSGLMASMRSPGFSGVSERVLQSAQFISLTNQRARVILDALGRAITVAGSPGGLREVKRTWGVWVITLQ